MASVSRDRGKSLIESTQQWDKVVALSGHKNVRSAKESYRVMEGKLGLGAGGSPSSPTKVKKRTGKVGTKAASQGTKARGKKAVNNEEEGGSEDAVVPKGKKGAVKTEESQEMGEGV